MTEKTLILETTPRTERTQMTLNIHGCGQTAYPKFLYRLETCTAM